MGEQEQAGQSGMDGSRAERAAEAQPDLSFLLPMLDKVRAVEIRFQDGGPGSGMASADLQPLAALQARVQFLEQEVQTLRLGLADVTSALKTGAAGTAGAGLFGPLPTELAPQSLRRLALGAAVAIALLLAAHLLVVVVFDLHTVVLRLVSIAIPFAVAIALTLGRQIRLKVEAVAAVAIGLLSVLGMSYVTSAVEGTSVLPENVREWRETLEYAASISFAYVTGVLISSGWQAHRGMQHEVGVNTLRLAQAIARLTGKAVATGPEINSQIASIQQLINTLALVSAGATSLVTALRSVLE